MKRYKSLYDGTLGEVVATEQAIDLTADSKPVQKFTYRTGQLDREVVTEHVTKMLNNGII